jgi:hypothetical protein
MTSLFKLSIPFAALLPMAGTQSASSPLQVTVVALILSNIGYAKTHRCSGLLY